MRYSASEKFEIIRLVEQSNLSVRHLNLVCYRGLTVNDNQFLEIICNRNRRTTNYREMVIGYYDRVTDDYRDRWGDSFHLPVFQGCISLAEAIAGIERRVVNEGGFFDGSEALDIGCGIGGPTIHMATLTSARFTGINIVSQQIAIAQQRAEILGLSDRVRFKTADAMNLEFKNEYFDTITVFESGCHMPDKSIFYKECARMIKPGGYFLGIDWMMTAGLTKDEVSQYIDPICMLHGIPDLIDVDEFCVHLSASGFALDTVEDLTDQSGLLNVRNIGNPPHFMELLSRGLPPVQELLSLGGVALTVAAQASAFNLIYWVGRRI